jgi:hypothetical protein
MRARMSLACHAASKSLTMPAGLSGPQEPATRASGGGHRFEHDEEGHAQGPGRAARRPRLHSAQRYLTRWPVS